MASPLQSALKVLTTSKPEAATSSDDESELDRDLEDMFDEFERATDRAAKARALKAFVKRSAL